MTTKETLTNQPGGAVQGPRVFLGPGRGEYSTLFLPGLWVSTAADPFPKVCPWLGPCGQIESANGMNHPLLSTTQMYLGSYDWQVHVELLKFFTYHQDELTGTTLLCSD